MWPADEQAIISAVLPNPGVAPGPAGAATPLPPDWPIDSPFEAVRAKWCRLTYPNLIARWLTGICNGHEHLSPLRSSHASLLESPRRKENSDAKNGDRIDEPGRTYSVLTNVSSWSG
jgi:hypothetical protein